MFMQFTVDKANNYIKKNIEKTNLKQRHLYHLMPPIGWMNDPNGVIYYRGQYHVFYQFYPYEAQWGPMHWGHAVSNDLLTWQHLPIALSPDMTYEDGCFSGGAIEVNHQLYLLYTSHYHQGYQKQEQSLAISSDGITFEKHIKNPIIKIDDLPDFASKIDFRDPNPVIIEGKKFLLVGSSTKDNKGQIIIYKTEDYITYQYLNTIQVDPYFGEIAECPDLFELDGKHVLLFSSTNLKEENERFKNINSSLYAVGKFDVETGAFEVEHIDEIDSGHHFYAPQTLLGPQNERVMIAWMEMWHKPYYTQIVGHQWVGSMILPRKLNLVNNRLIQTPINTQLIKQKTVIKDVKEMMEPKKVAKVFHLHTKLKTNKDIHLRIQASKSDYLILQIKEGKISLDTSQTKLSPFDARSMSFNHKQAIIDVYMDVSSLEVFIKDHDKTITTRVYFDEQQVELAIDHGIKDIDEFIVKEFIVDEN